MSKKRKEDRHFLLKKVKSIFREKYRVFIKVNIIWNLLFLNYICSYLYIFLIQI